MAMKLVESGRRIEITGDTYPVRDRIRAIGGHWDADRKVWWVGTGKRAEAQALVAAAPATQAAARSDATTPLTDDDRLLGQVETPRGKAWWCGQTADGRRYRLASMDGARTWWADAAGCRVVKTYPPRKVWDGRYCSGRTVDRYQTWGSMRRFLAERRSQSPAQREEADSRRAAIRECGGVCRCARPIDEGDGSCMACGYAMVGGAS